MEDGLKSADCGADADLAQSGQAPRADPGDIDMHAGVIKSDAPQPDARIEPQPETTSIVHRVRPEAEAGSASD